MTDLNSETRPLETSVGMAGPPTTDAVVLLGDEMRLAIPLAL